MTLMTSSEAQAARLSAIRRPQPVSLRHMALRGYHLWTEADDDAVRREYDGTWQATDRIALRLGVSFYAVKGRAARLGVSRSLRPDWTAKEVAFLETYAKQHSAQWIAARLPGRSLVAVNVKIKRLGLSRRERDGWYTKTEACQILGVEHRWIQARIDRGELKATHHHGERPGQDGGRLWNIEVAALRAFVLNNLESLSGRNVDLVGLVSLLLGDTWHYDSHVRP